MRRKTILRDEKIRGFLEESDDSSETDDFSDNENEDSESNFTEEGSEVEDEVEVTDNEDANVSNRENILPIEYIAKDGAKWKSVPENVRKTPRHNIISSSLHKVLLPHGKSIDNPIDAFHLFFDENIIKLIVKYTNIEARRLLQDKWKMVDEIEIRAYIGLLMTMGLNKQNNIDITEYWNPLFGNPIFVYTMGKNRFLSIERFLRFDDKNSRPLRKSKDKLAPIRELWEEINHKLQKYYLPGENLTIDEQLIPFRGRVSFKQYLPSKPDKYGIKMWWICDSKTSFPLCGIPYLGKDGSKRTENLAYTVVNKLCEPYFRTKRNITFDNYFTSFEVAKSLYENGLTMVGTIKKNKRCVPQDFLPSRNRNAESNIFGFLKNYTLVSYVPKKNRAVIFLSTMHHTKEVDISNKNKSEVNLYYNATKGGVDTLDQMAQEYTVRRKTNRWSVAFFQNIVDIVGVASLIIWKNKNPLWNLKKKNSKRKLFLREVAQSLVQTHAQRRGKKGLTKSHIEVIQKINNSSMNFHLSNFIEEPIPKRKRCHICPSRISRNSKQTCCKCLLNVCCEHSKKEIICTTCKN